MLRSNFFRGRWYGSCIETINHNLKNLKYEVRGELEITALRIKQELMEMRTKEVKNEIYPFEHIVECHIGNPQMFGYKPNSFVRDVMAGCLQTSSQEYQSINSDAKKRASYYTQKIGPSIGAYTMPNGYEFARQEVSKFISLRDGTPEADPRRIIMCDGATQGITLIMKALLRKGDGVLNPHPSYPLYSALIGLQDAKEIPYMLQESNNWSISLTELEQAYQNSVKQGIKPRIIILVNPNNPTGNVMEQSEIEGIIKFAYDHDIAILADEVYQENIYDPKKKFHSVNKIRSQMKKPYNSVEVFSFHSASKGLLGECGFRGGYLQISEIDEQVLALINKLKSIEICTNSMGQVLMSLQCTPPNLKDCCSETVELYKIEQDAIFQSLKNKAQLLCQAFNNIPGINCQSIQGSLFAFPSIQLPKSYINNAIQNGMTPDAFYCMEALKCLGLVIIPGSGFGQVPGTYHFRMSILPSEAILIEIMMRFQKWHHCSIQQFEPKTFSLGQGLQR